MQTRFSAAQLQDPGVATIEPILRKCVHCGFCTATCPTYVLLGDELDSPRGRIYLIKEKLENGRPASAEVALHVDRCLSCLACMTTCPSGVHYQHLIAHARAHVERAGFQVREIPEGHLCCGSAGSYNILQPEIAARLRSRKLENIGRTGAALVATGNIGCMIQLAGAGSPPIVHTAELLDWAAGGPRPGALG